MAVPGRRSCLLVGDTPGTQSAEEPVEFDSDVCSAPEFESR